MKTEIRKTTLEKIKAVSSDDFQKSIERIHHALFNHPKWEKADTIGLTVSRGREIPTLPVIERAWAEGKKVLVPKCVPLTKALVFRQLNSLDQLESVYYGLLEPIIEVTEAVPKNLIDLIIVPGVAYDPLGYRIGFGGGYYDRFLADYAGDTLAMALGEQLIERVPEEKHDQPVQTLITPDMIFECIHARKLNRESE